MTTLLMKLLSSSPNNQPIGIDLIAQNAQLRFRGRDSLYDISHMPQFKPGISLHLFKRHAGDANSRPASDMYLHQNASHPDP